MKTVLVSSFDLEVGGVERSLINMLEKFDYYNYKVDLMLYRHQGDFLKFLPDKCELLEEVDKYTAFRKPISELIREKQFILALARLMARYSAGCMGKIKGLEESGYYQMQLMWKYSLPFLPRFDKAYDIAISYLWPHYFVAHKVSARKKIAWIHTDYSSINADKRLDFKMWDRFDHIIAVSNHCRKAFLSKYPGLENKTVVMENITSPCFVREMSNMQIDDLEPDGRYFRILTVARLSHAKGIDNAVKALKLLHDRGMKDIKWYVIGYGGDEAMISELICKNGLEDSFILLGKKINPYPYMKICDLYVQPSRYEGKAVTVTEAQILGKPALITDYATARSQISNGFDGYITELSIAGIANGIEKLYKEPGLKECLAGNCMSTDYSIP